MRREVQNETSPQTISASGSGRGDVAGRGAGAAAGDADDWLPLQRSDAAASCVPWSVEV